MNDGFKGTWELVFKAEPGSKPGYADRSHGHLAKAEERVEVRNWEASI